MSAQLTVVKRQPRRAKLWRIALYAFLTSMALLWLVPVAGAIYASLRPYSETQKLGIFSLPKTFTFQNYRNAFNQGGMGRAFGNTMFIVIPSLVLILFLSSAMAFAVSRFSWRFNVTLLLVFTAGNLLPPQVLFQPLFQMFKAMPWPDFLSDTNTGNLLGTKIAVIIVHVAFQTGFCTFVLSNYMKTIPKELGEAAMVDGATVVRQFFQVVMPLCRPALAALATLEFTWLYNDFFWAVVLLNQGDQRPITSSIANLGGQFFSDDNLIAAASMIIAVPTLVVYLALQRHFISGLTLGANKG
ncbi:MAG: carbohydrate ABC transporter permease [Ilumatobacteraceae bacterium]|nr:carbohydrate ABC transporter permease [Ilumatobacteraceae bacterium]